MICDPFREQLLDFALDEKRGNATLRAHLDSCADCRALIASQRALVGSMDRTLSEGLRGEPSPAFAARIRERIAEEGGSRPAWSFGRFPVVAGLALAVLLGAWITYRAPWAPRPKRSIASASEVRREPTRVAEGESPLETRAEPVPRESREPALEMREESAPERRAEFESHEGATAGNSRPAAAPSKVPLAPVIGPRGWSQENVALVQVKTPRGQGEGATPRAPSSASELPPAFHEVIVPLGETVAALHLSEAASLRPVDARTLLAEESFAPEVAADLAEEPSAREAAPDLAGKPSVREALPPLTIEEIKIVPLMIPPLGVGGDQSSVPADLSQPS